MFGNLLAINKGPRSFTGLRKGNTIPLIGILYKKITWEPYERKDTSSLFIFIVIASIPY